jgi:hypothetical protein
MGAGPLLRAAADAGLHVMGQWRHGDRAFVCAAPRQQRLPLAGDERPNADDRTGGIARTRSCPPGTHGDGQAVTA